MGVYRVLEAPSLKLALICRYIIPRKKLYQIDHGSMHGTIWLHTVPEKQWYKIVHDSMHGTVWLHTTPDMKTG